MLNLFKSIVMLEMMKKFYVFIALAILAVSCKKEHTTTISGTVTGIPDGEYVYLKNNIPSTLQLSSIDSAVIKNGRFAFTLNTNELTENYLQFGDHKKLISFISEEGNIVVNFDSQDLSKNTVGGTYNNDKYQEYSTEANVYINQIKEFERNNQKKLIEAQTQNNTSLLQTINAENKKLQESYNNYNTTFVSTNKMAYVSLLLLDRLTKQGVYTFAEAKNIFNDFSADLKNSPLGKQMHDYLYPEIAKVDTSIGAKFPNYMAPSPNGENISIYNNLGKITIVDIWASWCQPCRAENPNLVKLYNEFNSKGLQIIGISLDKNKDSWEKAIIKDKLTWPQLSNLKQWDEPIVKKLSIQEIPAMFLIDSEGKIIGKNLKYNELKEKLTELL